MLQRKGRHHVAERNVSATPDGSDALAVADAVMSVHDPSSIRRSFRSVE
jgi:hypothetical protein